MHTHRVDVTVNAEKLEYLFSIKKHNLLIPFPSLDLSGSDYQMVKFLFGKIVIDHTMNTMNTVILITISECY